MCAITKCLLYMFLCLAIFCEIESKGQISNDGEINIDDAVKGEVIEGSGHDGDTDDVDHEESSGLPEDDEDAPQLSVLTPGSGPGGGGTALYEIGSGRRQGKDDLDYPDVQERVTSSVAPRTFRQHEGTTQVMKAVEKVIPTSPPKKSQAPTPYSHTETRRDDELLHEDTHNPPEKQQGHSDETEGSTSSFSDTDWDSDIGSDVIPTSLPPTSPPPTSNEELERDYPDDPNDDESSLEGSGTGTVVSKEARRPVRCADRDRRCTGYKKENRCNAKASQRWRAWMKEYCPYTCGYCDSGPKSRGPKGGKKEKGQHATPKVPRKQTTSKKPLPPEPTKFITRVNGNGKDDKYDDSRNEIHPSGGTEYDNKNKNGQDDFPNEIPSIGESVMAPKPRAQDSNLWTQPGILAGIIGAAVVGLLCAVLFVMFIVYRMRKKDEGKPIKGSYDLDETTKRSPRMNGYQKTNQHEFYA